MPAEVPASVEPDAKSKSPCREKRDKGGAPVLGMGQQVPRCFSPVLPASKRLGMTGLLFEGGVELN